MSHQFKNLHWARDIQINNYLMPGTLDEALDLLEQYQGKAQVVAGGTDVIGKLRHRDLEVDALVDITRLPDMDGIGQDGEMINMSIPLLALNASVSSASKEGQRETPLTEFFLDKGRTAIDCRKEILLQIRFPASQSDQGCCHLRLSKRRSLTIAILVLAAVVKVDAQKKIIQEAAIAMGPVAPTPFRAVETEALLAGAPVSRETIERAAETAFAEVNPIDSAIWGSAEYKREMVKVFVKRGLEKALIEAGAFVE
jgi:carbon-monoxide dehydrogenase medium subunit